MNIFDVQSSEVLEWVYHILFAGSLASLFALAYVKFGEAHSNRRVFAQNFVLVAVVTTVIIMIIKQSIALSLGLVGALSIVRFRAAIKEPEELSFLFMMVAIGIGVGAGELGLIFIFSAIVLSFLLVRNLFFQKSSLSTNAFNVNIISKKAKIEGPQSVLDIQKKWCKKVSIKRFDENEDELDLLMFAEFENSESLVNWRKEIVAFDNTARVSFLDQKNVF